MCVCSCSMYELVVFRILMMTFRWYFVLKLMSSNIDGEDNLCGGGGRGGGGGRKFGGDCVNSSNRRRGMAGRCGYIKLISLSWDLGSMYILVIQAPHFPLITNVIPIHYFRNCPVALDVT